MAEQNKEAKAPAAADDKSINELLKEYADDVKDKDLDDFLKSGDEDAFESDDSDSDEGEDADKSDEALAKKSGGGILTGLILLVAFAAAGAGTYVYLNREEGMTAIMGGFMGGETKAEADTMQAPPAPELAPTLPAPSEQQATAIESPLEKGELPAQPTTIMNETLPMPSASSDMEPPASELVSSAEVAQSIDVLATPMSARPEAAPALNPTPAPANDNAPAATPVEAPAETAKAVDAWTAGINEGMDNTAAKLPEQPVAELNAKPVKAPKQETSEAAPKKAKAVASGADAALPPPYLSIQAQKGGAIVPTKGKMAPVVEGRAKSGRNINEADVTSATGDYRNMVINGGGKIEVAGSKTTFVPAGTKTDMAEPAPAEAPVTSAPRLAISGGKSLPDGYQATAPVAAPKVQAPEAVETPAPQTSTPAQNSNDAKSVLAQAMSLEKSGKTGDALELYQRALELDAVYGDGKSIDRGMVYDRIGAIRSGSK